MFSEWGTIEGGRLTGYGEYSSEQLYGKRRYPDELLMMSQEVDDVLTSRVKPLDMIRLRVPHCSMPAPDASQARITPAYHEDKSEAREFLAPLIHEIQTQPSPVECTLLFPETKVECALNAITQI